MLNTLCQMIYWYNIYFIPYEDTTKNIRTFLEFLKHHKIYTKCIQTSILKFTPIKLRSGPARPPKAENENQPQPV